MTFITALQIENDTDNLAYAINQQLDDTDTIAECLSDLRAACSKYAVGLTRVQVDIQGKNWKLRYTGGQLTGVAKLEQDGNGSDRSSWDWDHGSRGDAAETFPAFPQSI
jgi:hypothetical protein